MGLGGLEAVRGKFGVPGVKRNGAKLINLCMEKRMCIGNAYIETSDVHKFTWVSEINDSGSLMDFIIKTFGRECMPSSS